MKIVSVYVWAKLIGFAIFLVAALLVALDIATLALMLVVAPIALMCVFAEEWINFYDRYLYDEEFEDLEEEWES